jgi:ParB-like chromosome segregation protein Spo0J
MSSIEPAPASPVPVVRLSGAPHLDPEVRTVVIETWRLSPGPSVRTRQLRQDHVRLLVASGGSWPPLLVHKQDLVVIDGIHRLAAAAVLGLRTLEVRLFEGSQEEALIAAIRGNVTHGLLLTLAERKAAATRLLAIRPEWSDRRIARICGVSGSTIQQLRGRYRTSETDGAVLATRRIGVDGKARPTDRIKLRHQIRTAIEANPDASLRVIAARTGASPTTVRTVRQALNSSPPPPVDDVIAAPDPLATMRHSRGSEKVWTSDSACSSAGAAFAFALWFDQTRVDPSVFQRYADTIPLSRVYEVVDEASRRAQMWSQFANLVEKRVNACGADV